MMRGIVWKKMRGKKMKSEKGMVLKKWDMWEIEICGKIF